MIREVFPGQSPRTRGAVLAALAADQARLRIGPDGLEVQRLGLRKVAEKLTHLG